MKVSVWDTYVTKKDGAIMHFDILVAESEKEERKILGYGKAYLKSKGQEGQSLTSKECNFCHLENAAGEIALSINERGHYIVEMQGCQ